MKRKNDKALAYLSGNTTGSVSIFLWRLNTMSSL